MADCQKSAISAVKHHDTAMPSFTNWPWRLPKYRPPQFDMALPWPIFDNTDDDENDKDYPRLIGKE
ncbi:hypothetical protein L195_g023145 [Trifolium pratense]|uniref:Uncharacterized protein n=1 Tax=Trifolium pratense TaxID=57577 RepID=A0A2K3M6N2_TRIPR|nr:hypothetical protein L195_g042529 [Trifolium pratense]PNX86452.1 hypothetical protein L195_g042530 [Trifolium pratense]PNX99874.1 hypothetical protein L195_g023145 [Trifolium pratense]